jgi:hypothetical protein
MRPTPTSRPRSSTRSSAWKSACFDPSISNYVLSRFVKRNIKVHTGVAVTRFDP